MKLAGVEFYFHDLKRARAFYRDVLGLRLSGEEPGHHAQFDAGPAFLCLEKKGAESYPSRDKAVIFLEVEDLTAAVKKIGRQRFVEIEMRPERGGPSWAVLHDPEGHNVLLLETKRRRKNPRKARRTRKR